MSDGQRAIEAGGVSRGVQARALRLRRGLTLEALAAQAGLSKGHLSRFERGEKSLSIAALLRLSQALQTSVSALLGEGGGDAVLHIVRRDGRQARALAPEDAGYAFSSLSRAGDAGAADVFIVDLPMAAVRDSEFHHAGEEMIFVLDGSVEVEAAGQVTVLGKGDFLQFSGLLKHRLRGRDAVNQVLIMVSGGAAPAPVTPGSPP
ncbi:helix-turn-helix domain-containing protein [Inquilinus limosus]|uniref:helix-turn-helix domain-containing protein n=1 Tax=Inquilinus limosus TaxID=171674 RepID=UPI00119827AA|nr:XRE family transcriptional regulator [Inquilinus limosus]